MDKTLIHCPSEHGHYGTYVKYLLDYIAGAELDPSQVVILAPHSFPNKRRDVVEQAKGVGVHIQYYAPLRVQNSRVNTLFSPLWDWHATLKQAAHWNPARVVFLNFDALAQVRLPVTRRLPFRVSGILYRPFPHYHTFATTQLTTALELKRARQQLLLTRTCRHPQLEALYWLDPYAAAYMNTKAGQKNLWLPDPVELEDNISPANSREVERIRRALGVPSNGRIWLVFGADIVRKGTREILQSLPTEAAVGDVTVALVGPVYPGQEAHLDQAVAAAQLRFPGRIVVHKQFVPEADVSKYFAAASLVLTLYQHHMGSSGALVRAAAAGKPVLSTEFGLLGHLTQTHRLGFTCNVGHEAALRHVLRLAGTGAVERAFDPATALAFAQEHSKLAFAERLLSAA